MKRVVNRGDGTLTIEKVGVSKGERRGEMYYMLEKMVELNEIVRKGKKAEVELSKLENGFKELCKLELEEE